MEVSPTNCKPDQEKVYELEMGKEKILLKIDISSFLLNISITYVNNSNIIYKNSFDQEVLCKINKVFK